MLWIYEENSELGNGNEKGKKGKRRMIEREKERERERERERESERGSERESEIHLSDISLV